MKITIEQAHLLKSLQVIERAVNERSALPILANVLLETKTDELVLTATDLDVGVRCRLALMEKAEPGAVAVPARRFATIVRELPQEKITLESKANHATTLICGASRFRMPGLPPEDFPILPSTQEQSKCSISQGTLKEMVSKTMFAMSMEESRFVLNGALFQIKDGLITIVATDGRRLALAQSPVESEGSFGLSVVVPAKTVRELGRLLENQEDEKVFIEPMKDNQLLFRFGDVSVMTRLIEGQFPPYESVIPAPSETTVRCVRQLLYDAIRRASLMTSATSQAVVFEISKDTLIVSKESVEFGSAREELQASYGGPPMTVAFNPEFWLDVLKTIDDHELSVEIVSPDKPAVIRIPKADQERGASQTKFLHILLPMKLS
jgi:DNA polymerase-3 subunit beta